MATAKPVKKASSKRKKTTATAKTPAKSPKKSVSSGRKTKRASKGLMTNATNALVEAVSTIVGGAVAGAAAAGTKLVEEKTGSNKKPVETKRDAPKGTAKKRAAAAK